MNYYPTVTCLLAGLVISLIAIPTVLRACTRRPFLNRAADFHHDGKTVPRLGGLALAFAYVGVLSITAFWFPHENAALDHALVICLSPLAMFAVGFWDDLKPLGAKKKFLLQILIAIAVCALGIHIERFKNPFTGDITELREWGFVLTVLWLVGTTNLINLVDGVDGLAGGICLMLMSLLAYECSSSLQLLSAGVAGALLGFLRYNFPPARIYLGDGGAYFLGFQIGLFSLVSSQKGTIAAALIAPMFVLSLPIVDVTLAILRRGLRGLPVFHPDRRHLHHHLLQMGFSRRKVVLLLYSVTLVFLLLGFVTFWSKGHWTPILAGVGALILLVCAGGLRFSREWFAVGRTVGNSLAMRHDIQSALCLTRWLTMEARRRNSPEALWQDLIFVAERLGFTFVAYGEEREKRVWERNASLPSTLHVDYTIPGRPEIMTLRAPQPPGNIPANAVNEDDSRFADSKLFTIIGELLAESWILAIRNWETQHQRTFSFASKPSESAKLSSVAVPLETDVLGRKKFEL